MRSTLVIEKEKEGEIVALFCIRVCARETVIWPALYRPVYVVVCVLYVFLNGSSSVCKPAAYAYSGRVQRYKNETGACQCVRRRVIKKEDKENRCRFNFDFRPIQIDRGSLLHPCSISLWHVSFVHEFLAVYVYCMSNEIMDSSTGAHILNVNICGGILTCVLKPCLCKCVLMTCGSPVTPVPFTSLFFS